MVSPKLLPLAAGFVTLLATAALLLAHSVVSVHATRGSPAQATSALSAALEGVVFCLLAWVIMGYALGRESRRSSGKCPLGLVLGLTVGIYSLAIAASLASVVILSTTMEDMADSVLDTDKNGLLLGYSIVIGLSCAFQLLLLVILGLRTPLGRFTSGSSVSPSVSRDPGSPRWPQMHVKSIRYSQTVSSLVKPEDVSSSALRTPPRSSSGKSAGSSPRSSMCQTMRSMSSKTRLLSTREKNRPASIDSQHWGGREGSIMTQDSFDMWDTSAVDPQNRLTALNTAATLPLPLPHPSQSSRHLETIPASPTASRSSSPGQPLELDLGPPRAPATARRSRSYSPARRPESSASTLPGVPGIPGVSGGSDGEAHIHPLFRSDSPAPPNVTAGTIVTAAPQAARIVSDRQSVRRMRSMPAVRDRSPLSSRSETTWASRTSSSLGCRGEEDAESSLPPSERVLTPPIPEWILTAGARSSLTGYESRKLKVDCPSQTSSP